MENGSQRNLPSIIEVAAAGSANHITQEIDYEILVQDFESALKMEFKESVTLNKKHIYVIIIFLIRYIEGSH